eukprot:TRINITY_DN7709_c3_g1_i2.p2 TRINITY_DN7709_c3_g1~~TRINITY_DN7709_c3_g1_i2.p2  ORF type:complete len:224 (+),score=-10.02 TRINITY_DN7709_c3_g1_i2:158-829(+)
MCIFKIARDPKPCAKLPQKYHEIQNHTQESTTKKNIIYPNCFQHSQQKRPNPRKPIIYHNNNYLTNPIESTNQKNINKNVCVYIRSQLVKILHGCGTNIDKIHIHTCINSVTQWDRLIQTFFQVDYSIVVIFNNSVFEINYDRPENIYISIHHRQKNICQYTVLSAISYNGISQPISLLLCQKQTEFLHNVVSGRCVETKTIIKKQQLDDIKLLGATPMIDLV